MKRPFRFWMTGCVAVVMAALGGRDATAEDRHAVARSSRYSLHETVQRLEACAPRHGLSVFARVEPPATRPGLPPGDRVTLIVFESAQGGTPVLMDGPASPPRAPLALWVRSRADGSTQVLLASDDWADLPDGVARELTELPRLVADALA